MQKPKLKRLAKTPPIGPAGEANPVRDEGVHDWWGIKLKNIVGPGEMSVYGTPGENGVRVIQIAATHPLAKAGLRQDDVIIGVNGQEVSLVCSSLNRWIKY